MVKRLKSILIAATIALTLLLVGQTAHAAATQVQLILASDSAQPGDTIMAGLHFHMQPTWHIYWRNPGIGIPPSIKWQLPAGVTAGEIQWPVPGKLTVEGLTTYDYDDDVVLLVPLTISADAKAGMANLKGHVAWQECSKECVQQSDDVQTQLTIGKEKSSSSNAALLDTWQKKLPQIKTDLPARASWQGAPTGDNRNVLIDWPATGTVKSADFFPNASDKFEVQGETLMVPGETGHIRIQKTVNKYEGPWPDHLAGLLVQKTGDATVAYEVNLPITDGKTAIAPGTSPTATVSSPGKTAPPVAPISLPVALLYAFIGGLILNVMPCVLPVISLKILGFVSHNKEHPERVRKLGFSYAGGVLVSFLALAGLVIIVKSLGHAASWGMQFQSPQFVVGMAVLVTLIALNLFGVFEINLSGRLMSEAGDLASREGYSGAFLNGVLATVLATPCTAPYVGSALGFAFLEPSPIIVLIFLTIGAGLALPYVVFSWDPALLKFLPRPGAWMEKFKIAMGFPMLATAVWMYTLVTASLGPDSDFLVGLFLVLVALAAWIWGQFVQRGRSRQGLAIAICLAILAFDYAYLLEGELHWRHPVIAKQGGSLKTSPDGIDWQPWSPDAIKQARTTGRPILVDFTAKWCPNCQVNLKTSIEISSVRAKLKDINAIAFVENSFTKDATVVAELNRYQRAGVPLVLVYPRNPNDPPQVLPELLTPGIVLEALDKAAAD